MIGNMGSTGVLDVLGALSGKPTTDGPLGILSSGMAELPVRGVLSSDRPSPEIVELLLGVQRRDGDADNLTRFTRAKLLAMLRARGIDLGAPGFKRLTPVQQLQKADLYFGDLSAGILDPGSNEYQDARTRFRANIMPALKLSRTPVDDMGTMERLGRGAIAGIEDLGLGATQLGNEALRVVGAPGALERAVELRRCQQIIFTSTIGPDRIVRWTMTWNQAVESTSNLASCAQSCKSNFLTVPKARSTSHGIPQTPPLQHHRGHDRPFSCRPLRWGPCIMGRCSRKPKRGQRLKSIFQTVLGFGW